MFFFLKLILGYILLLIIITLWYVTIPIIALYIVYRMRKYILAFFIMIEVKREKSNLIRFNLPEYIAINIFGDDYQSKLKFSDLKMYNYLTDFYLTQKYMSYIEKSYIPNVINLHCNLHDRLIANSKIIPTVEFTQTYELTQKYFQDCISNYENYKNKHEQKKEYESEKNSYYWHDRWNNSQDRWNNSQDRWNNSQDRSHRNTHRNEHHSSHRNARSKSHKSKSYSNSKKSRKSAEKEAQIRVRLDKFGISEPDAEIIFGKSWRTKLGKPDGEFFYIVQRIAINIEYDFDGRYRRKYGSLYFKVLEIIQTVTGTNTNDYTDDTNDYTDDTNDYTDDTNDYTDDTNDYTNDSTLDDLKSSFHTMGLKNTSTMDEIKTRYKELILKHHPDRNHGSQKSTQKTTEINNAYELIMGVKNTA